MNISAFPSRLLSCILLLGIVPLAACQFLIPEDQSAPRYNTVVGEKRIPERNRELRAAPQSSFEPSPAANNFGAPQRLSTAPASAAQNEERSVWDRVAFWEPSAVEVPVGVRQVPEENNELANVAPAAGLSVATSASAPASVITYAPPSQSFQLATVGFPTANPESYPQLSAVPARPVSDAARLDAVRAQLAQDRLNAAQASSNLSAAAAAEPSLLAPIPEPVAVTSLPPPPAPAQPLYQTPPAPLPAQPLPLAPIALRPPAPAPAATPVIQYGAPPAPQALPPAAAGGFNPLAGAYPNPTGYLPESRYAR